jgi:hypothetical protein
MKAISKTALVTSGIRGLFCAGLATMITGFFSWSFVASTDSLDWMGSGAYVTGEAA